LIICDGDIRLACDRDMGLTYDSNVWLTCDSHVRLVSINKKNSHSHPGPSCRVQWAKSPPSGKNSVRCTTSGAQVPRSEFRRVLLERRTCGASSEIASRNKAA
jgi:hypothetical protein